MTDKRKINKIFVQYKKEEKVWEAKKSNAERASIKGNLKSDVMIKAREIAQNQKLERVEKNKKGLIVNSNSYGNDPLPPRDKKF
jgi:hypothetical protein